jgi:hypothetical protein
MYLKLLEWREKITKDESHFRGLDEVVPRPHLFLQAMPVVEMKSRIYKTKQAKPAKIENGLGTA